MPESEIKDRRVDVDAGLKDFERPTWVGKSREGEPNGSVQIQAVDSLGTVPLAWGRSSERARRLILLALRDFEIRQDHLRILFRAPGPRRP